jgi:UDP-N-acetylglucosamine acyltransferase
MHETARIVPHAPQVHETAIVHPGARLGAGCTVGPYAVIGDGVELGAGCEVMSHVRIDGPLVAGSGNRFFHGAAIGGLPQDLKYDGADSRVRIGNANIFREFVTVNRATGQREATEIGNDNLLMAYVHVAHDCVLSDHTILGNSVNLAGHVIVEDYAIVGGVTPVHQFTRIGRHAIVGGGSRVPKDVLPFMKAAGNPLRVVGPNSVGLRRRGFSEETRRTIKEAFRLLCRSGLNVSQAVERIHEELPDSAELRVLLEFIHASRRGICV